jgi:hypothetical protein
VNSPEESVKHVTPGVDGGGERTLLNVCLELLDERVHRKDTTAVTLYLTEGREAGSKIR